MAIPLCAEGAVRSAWCVVRGADLKGGASGSLAMVAARPLFLTAVA